MRNYVSKYGIKWKTKCINTSFINTFLFKTEHDIIYR